MIVATLESSRFNSPVGRLDGELVIVHPDRAHAARLPRLPGGSVLSFREALDDWTRYKPKLEEVDKALRADQWRDTIALDGARFMAPLPRTWALLDGSAFIQHVILVRKARGAEPPEDLFTIPLMYQGDSDNLLGPNDPIPLVDPAHGMDFEAEVVVVTSAVPMGIDAERALDHVEFIMLMNDVSLRELIPRELATGFGFFHGKPPSSFSPFALTPDELTAAWSSGRLMLPVTTTLNGKPFGHPDAGEMHFSFGQLIAHAAKTRPLSAGTIIGSGTVSNKDESVGSSCLAEKRMLEKIKTGTISTPFMKAGDRVRIEVLGDGVSLFGAIDQEVVAVP